MNKKLVAVLVALAVIAGGFFLIKSIDTTPVTHAGCVVTDTTTHYFNAKQGGTKRYIETENCGKLRSSRKAQQTVETGKTYDLTATGLFSNGKHVTKVQER